MKTLIVDDEFMARNFLLRVLARYGECMIAINGIEAVNAFKNALEENKPFDLICMDIMMPEMNGLDAIKKIREIEEEKAILPPNEVKILMTTALGDPKTVIDAYYQGGATSYIVKPFRINDIITELQKMGLKLTINRQADENIDKKQ
jgi:two-component system chemotaxis response regulator CheY